MSGNLGDEIEVAPSPLTEDDQPTGSASAGIAVIKQAHTIPMSGVRKVTTKFEVFAYCLMGIGMSGLGPFVFMPTQLQYLLSIAFPSGFVNWGGGSKSISAMILDLTGIQFAADILLLLCIGPYADYGNWRPYVLIVFTIITWAVSFGELGLTSPGQWQAAGALYVLATVSFNVVNTFYYAAFPGLVRDMPELIESEVEVMRGTKSPHEHAELDMQERSKISNYSLAAGSLGTAVILIIGLAIVFKVKQDTDMDNVKIYSYMLGYYTAIWVLISLPWFVLEQHRPGQELPAGTTMVTVGPKQMWQAVKGVWQLKWTLLYLLAFFIMNDLYWTAGTLISVMQNDAIEFDTKSFSYLNILNFGAQAVGAYAIATAQRIFKFTAKSGAIYGASCMTFSCLWGLIGLWTDKIGYHNIWEFYAFQGFVGIGFSAWLSYQNTVLSEVVPAPKMYLFFSLFYIVGKSSSFVGPFISSAIIDRAGGNNNAAFWFLFFSGLLGVTCLIFLDVDKAKEACAKYLEREAMELYTAQQRDHVQDAVLDDSLADQDLSKIEKETVTVVHVLDS